MQIALRSYKLFFISRDGEESGKEKKVEKEQEDNMLNISTPHVNLLTLYLEAENNFSFSVKLLFSLSLHKHRLLLHTPRRAEVPKEKENKCKTESRSVLNRHALLGAESRSFAENSDSRTAQERRRVCRESTNSFFRSFHSMIALTLSH